MKKLLIILIILSSILFINNVYAKEIVFEDVIKELDTSKYPYYAIFATDNFETQNTYAYFYSERPFKVNKIENKYITIEPEIQRDSNISLNYEIYKNNELIGKGLTRLTRKFEFYVDNYKNMNYISNFNIKNNNDEVIFAKRLINFDINLGYEIPNNMQDNVSNFYFKNENTIYENDFNVEYLDDYSKENLVKLYEKALSKASECKNYYIGYGSKYVSYKNKYVKGIQLMCMEEEDYFSYLNIRYIQYAFLDYLSFDTLGYIEIDDSSSDKKTSYFYFLNDSTNEIDEVNDSLSNGARTLSSTNPKTFNFEFSASRTDKDLQGLKKEITTKNSGIYSNIKNFTYYINKSEENGGKFLKSFKYQNNNIFNGSLIVFEPPEPSLTYKIKDSVNGYKVELKYLNMTDDYITYYEDLKTGNKIDIIPVNNSYTIDNLTMDAIITVYIKNKNNDEIVFTQTIDINNIQLDMGKDTYIEIKGYNQEKLNSVIYAYKNVKKEHKCFYQIGSSELVEQDCNNNNYQTLTVNKNTFVIFYIKKDNEIIFKKGVNLNFLENYPQIKFNSFFDKQNSVQLLDINVYNTIQNDISSYSYDNEIYTQFDNNYIRLKFYQNNEVYVKVERNNVIVAEGYILITYNSLENGNPTGVGNNITIDSILDYFNNLSYDFNNIKILFNNVWQILISYNLVLYFLLIITGSLIILIIKSIHR